MSSPAEPETTTQPPAPDIQVTVRVRHSAIYSGGAAQAFEYTITIENHSDQSWQLLTRHWEISDAAGQTFTVDGDGVVGEQPILAPGARYTYNSFVTIDAMPGVMRGHYVMQDAWGERVKVAIPPFRLDSGERVLN